MNTAYYTVLSFYVWQSQNCSNLLPLSIKEQLYITEYREFCSSYMESSDNFCFLGDARASWLPADVAHGGPHNWSKKEGIPAPVDIKDPRHGV